MLSSANDELFCHRTKTKLDLIPFEEARIKTKNQMEQRVGQYLDPKNIKINFVFTISAFFSKTDVTPVVKIKQGILLAPPSNNFFLFSMIFHSGQHDLSKIYVF